MENLRQKIKEKSWLGWALFFATIVIVFLIGLFASTIIERKAESEFAYKPKIELRNDEPRSELWGKNFPKEYETYLRTKETGFKSKYNGNAKIDMLEVDPRLVILWAGYGFSKDYNQGRGHFYAVKDIRASLRTGAPMSKNEGPMPNTCWSCKSPDVPRLMKDKGVKEFYKGKWSSKGDEIVNAIGCADCHESKTMELQISRPALIEAFERRGEDISKSTHQEMRSLVCAQCHVEYYFKGKGKYLTFPWDEGMSVEAMEKYYDKANFKDWTHKLSRAPMLKAQHPGYELYKKGIHAQRGLACADCHMPYKSEGGQKFTSHHIQSPLNYISTTCQVCHQETEKELIKNVNERQDKIISVRDELEKLLVKAHIEAKFAWDKGAKDSQMKDVLTLIRHSQWRWDYAAASHGGSFHAPIETLRIIATGIEKAQEARIQLVRVLSSLGYSKSVPMPDVSTKARAQKYIGLNAAKMKKDKKSFLEKIVPQWLKKAKERESAWDSKQKKTL